MDLFVEQLIKKDLTLKNKLLITFIWLGVLIFCVYMIFFAFFAFMVIPLFGILYLANTMTQKQFSEYEYSAINGEITIDKIINKKIRKNLLQINAKQIEKLEKYQNNIPLCDLKKVLNFSANKKNNSYFIFKSQTNQKIMVIFSANEQILGAIRPFLKRR